MPTSICSPAPKRHSSVGAQAAQSPTTASSEPSMVMSEYRDGEGSPFTVSG